ncbi:LysR family transcriptional regulator [Pseudogemmobacter lacusdianii]
MKVTLLLLKERSVTRVAGQLAQSQPAVAALLKRARQVFGDPLLVRDGQHMVLTTRGEEIYRQLERAIAPLLAAISDGGAFEPSLSQKRFQVSILSAFAEYLVPDICQRLAREAPQASIVFSTPRSTEHITRDLGSGQLDLVIGNSPEPPGHLRFAAHCSHPFGCLMRADHPLAAEPLTTERYLSAKHIAPDSSSEMNLGPVKGRLSQLGLRREVSIKVADFHHVPAILAQTDVIFTSAAPYVQDLTRQSGGRLVAREAPAVLKKMDLYGW